MMNPIRAGIVSQVKDYRWVWTASLEENATFAGSLPSGVFMAKVAQVGAGKLFGSEEFVMATALALGSLFRSRRVQARPVDELGFATHGWRLAKEAVA